MTRLIAQRGKPGMDASDPGALLTSNAVRAWCGQIGVERFYIAPGKPMQKGYVESFSFRTTRQASALPRLRAGNGPGLAGRRPILRRTWLKARASASA